MNVNICHGKQRKLLRAFIREYGDDANLILNALHEMSVRIAITSGVDAERFGAGFKHHWDFLAHALNDLASKADNGNHPN